MSAPNLLSEVTLAELKAIPNWVTWKLEVRDGKATKPPFIAGTNTYASSTDSSTWTTFESANTSIKANGAQGIGFVLGGKAVEKKIVGIDVDGCRNPKTGEYAPWALELFRATSSYTENTPSGFGSRIWITGELPSSQHVFDLDPSAGYGDKVKIKIYGTARYYTWTNDSVYEQPVGIRPCDLAAVYELIRDIQKRYPPQSNTKSTVSDTSSLAPSAPSTGESVQIRNDRGPVDTTKYELLMHANISGDKPFHIEDDRGNYLDYADRSAADMALFNVSAIHRISDPDTQAIPQAILDDFRSSVIFREKEWGHRSEWLLKNTISKALQYAQEKVGSSSVEAPKVSVPPSDILGADSDLYPESRYRMSPEELAAQEDAEYPVYKLHESAGPDFDDALLYGPIGAVARRICQFSEAHAPTVYLNLIVSFGSMFGRGPYFNIDATKHYTNENIANVAPTSEGRKGTCSDAAEFFLRMISPAFMDRNNVSGFASSQAVIAQIKDSSTYQIRDRKTSAFKTVLVPGVEDKRLCIRENELSGLFKLLADSKNRAGELFRNAWDGKPLSNKVSGKTDEGEHRSLVCREPHVSIIGSTTPSLAKSTLPVGVDKSGDGNRFIWCFTKRIQLCPHGGPPIDWASETIEYAGVTVHLLVYLQQMLNEAYEPRLIPLTRAASKFCTHLYLRLENDRRIDFLGGMTRRAAAHIRRLAMILCLIDRENAVDVKHLQAAEAIWDFSQESARFIFKGYSLDQEKILRAAAEKNEGLTLTDVHELFKRHKSAEWRRAQLRGLVEGGYLTVANNAFKFKRW